MPNQYTKKKGLSSKEIIRAHGLYQCGLTLAKVSTRFSVSRGSMWNYFNRLGLECRPLAYTKKVRPCIEYKGIKYFKDSYGSYRASTKQRMPLHKAIWIDNHGPLQDHEIVSFIDDNKDNIVLDNLFLTTRMALMDKAHKIKGKKCLLLK